MFSSAFAESLRTRTPGRTTWMLPYAESQSNSTAGAASIFVNTDASTQQDSLTIFQCSEQFDTANANYALDPPPGRRYVEIIRNFLELTRGAMMRSQRRSFPRLAQACPRRLRSETIVDSPHPLKATRGEVAKKQLSNEIDVDLLLHFSQRLYAHALTLQEVIRNQGEATYEALRPRYDRQAAQQFEVFYQTFKRS